MELITNPIHFNTLCQSICDAQYNYIAIDTEFVREKTYWPKWSLLQIATPKDIYLIDVSIFNVKDNFDSFKNLLLQNCILKVFYACRQDIEIFFHELDTIPNGIFDCQIAATLCGYGEGMGMAAMAKELLGVDMTKSQQHTNWMIRPLSQKQLDYASEDVRVIRQLYLVLVQKIEEMKRWGWLHCEQAHLSCSRTYVQDHQVLWQKLKTHHKLKASKRALLQDLCQWREEKAQELNYNRGRVLTDETLIKILDIKSDDLIVIADTIPELPVDYLEEIVEVFKKFKLRSPQSYPQLYFPPSRPPYLAEALEKLKKLRHETSVKLRVPERLIAGVEEMKDFLSGEEVNFLKNWRFEVFGKQAEEILSLYKTNG